MGMKLGGLLQVIGAGVAGYYKGKKMEEDREEDKAARAEDRDYLRTKRQRETAEYDEAQNLKRDMTEAGKDITPEVVTASGATYSDAGGATADDLIASDNRENRRAMESIGQKAPDPIKPASFKVGEQTFTDRPSADQALMGTNSAVERNRRIAAAARKNGDFDKERQYLQFAEQAVGEGTDKILGTIAGTAPNLDAVKKAGGKLPGVISADAVDVFNKTGSRWKIGADTTVEHFVDRDAAGREFVNSRVMNKDGKPIVEDVHAASKMLLNVRDRMTQSNSETGHYLTAQQQAESSRHNKTVEATTAKHYNATEKIAAAQLGIAAARDKREAASFRKQSLVGQVEAIEEAMGSKFTADERKMYVQKLAGITSGKMPDAEQEKMFNAIVTKFGESNTDPKAIAQFSGDLRKSFGALKTNAITEDVVKTEMAKHKPGTPEYAATYAEAQQQARMTPQQLEAMGFKPPPVDKTKRPASSMGTAPAKPSLADQMGSTFPERQANLLKRQQAIANDPDLKMLETQRVAALQAGNRVAVNNIIAKSNALKAERYGD